MPTLIRHVRRWLRAVAALLPFLLAPAARAQSPYGSWQHSCTEQQIDQANKVVAGNCGKGGNLGIFATQRRHTTLIRYDLCAGDISNDHGHLTCTRQAPYRWTIPSSASITCMNGFTVDNRLYAKCKRKVDSWNWTSTPRTVCNSAVNSDGNISCSAASSTNGGPGGPSQPPVTTFRFCVTLLASGSQPQTITIMARTPAEAESKLRSQLPNNGNNFSIVPWACQ